MHMSASRSHVGVSENYQRSSVSGRMYQVGRIQSSRHRFHVMQINSKPKTNPYSSTLKAETSLVNSAACRFKLSAAAALSSTKAAFCCVI